MISFFFPSFLFFNVVPFLSFFLGATKHLYNWLCPSVGRLVGWSVTHSFDDPHVAPIGLLGLVSSYLSVRHSFFFLRLYFSIFLAFSRLYREAIRFPKLEECAHFHYDFVDIGIVRLKLLPFAETR